MKYPVHMLTLLALLSLLLVSCGKNGAPPDAPLTAQAVTTTQPAAGATAVPTDATVSIFFTEAMKRPSLYLGADIFPGRYDPDSDPTGLEPLELESLCDSSNSAHWRVGNPNDAPVSFTWTADQSTDRGLGVVPAHSAVVFTSGPQDPARFRRGCRASVGYVITDRVRGATVRLRL